MKNITQFRQGAVAKKFADEMARLVHPDRRYQIMEFCGGHTHAIHRYALPDLLPDNVEMIHGPGCPVCVLPMARIDNAIALEEQPNTILCSYGDMLRVPGANQDSLLKAKARGCDIRMVYSVDDALSIAKQHPTQQVVFFAIGFETTTPPTAMAILEAKKQKINNFYVFCNHVLTPVAMRAILDSVPTDEKVNIDGFIGPAHVSTVIGSDAYQAIAEDYQKPIVISGFEPLDLMQSITLLVELINNQQYNIVNQFTRAVTPTGNHHAKQMMDKVFELRDQFEWRGLGWIPYSALRIKPDYAEFDAEQHFTLPPSQAKEHKACLCGPILQGRMKPSDCTLFAKACTPENPLGACMVSAEGACAAYYAYGRLDHAQQN